MPIEIKELHLKFNLEGGLGSGDDCCNCSKSSDEDSDSANTGMNQQAIVQTCIEEVLRIIEHKAEQR